MKYTDSLFFINFADIGEKCPKNQEFMKCATPCPLVCGQPKPEICAAMCKPGCACPKNKWLREDGKCVKRKQCPEE